MQRERGAHRHTHGEAGKTWSRQDCSAAGTGRRHSVAALTALRVFRPVCACTQLMPRSTSGASARAAAARGALVTWRAARRGQR